MPGKYINPYTDFGFKRIFGREANKDILISFLNSLLPQRHQIADLRFLNNEQTPPRREVYAPILDLFCESPSGEQFIVEMQQENQGYFLDRTVYYTACAIRDQWERGQHNYRLAAVYFVGIMDFVHPFENSPPRLLHELSLKDQEGVEMYDKLRMYFIQMPLFKKSETELETQLDKWLFFLKNLPGLDCIPAVLREPVFEKAFETAEKSTMTREEEIEYRITREILYINKGVVETAEAKGEAKANFENARKMKALGLPVETIASVTGLAAAQIEEMK